MSDAQSGASAADSVGGAVHDSDDKRAQVDGNGQPVQNEPVLEQNDASTEDKLQGIAAQTRAQAVDIARRLAAVCDPDKIGILWGRSDLTPDMGGCTIIGNGVKLCDGIACDGRCLFVAQLGGKFRQARNGRRRCARPAKFPRVAVELIGHCFQDRTAVC
mgnify:CR=1 FL=1